MFILYGIRLKGTEKYLFSFDMQYNEVDYALNFGGLGSFCQMYNYLYVWRSETGARQMIDYLCEALFNCPEMEVVNLKEVFNND